MSDAQVLLFFISSPGDFNVLTVLTIDLEQ